MKIAVATDNGSTISRHFGRAALYLVFDVEAGAITAKEQRPKPTAHALNVRHSGDSRLPCDTAVEVGHAPMVDAIRDCDVILVAEVICSAYLEMKAYNIRPFVTAVENAEQAVRSFVDGQRADYTDWLH